MALSANIISVPKELCLYGNADETVDFFSLLYMDVPVICIDFTHTQRISAAAALALFAHANNIQQERGFTQSVIVNYSKSPIAHILKKSDLLKALNLPVGHNLSGGLFQFAKGSEIEVTRRQTFAQLDYYQQSFFRHCKYSEDEVEDFFRNLRHAIKEVQLNIVNHAYIGSESSNDQYDHYRDKIWWQMFWYLPHRRQVHFLIYDLGVGIVDSYVNYATGKRMKDYSDLNDRQILEEALLPGMSRMVGDGRGFGLSYLTAPLDRLPGSSLFLRTGRAGCHLDGRQPKNKQPRMFYFPDFSLTGTLIEWSFQLPG